MRSTATRPEPIARSGSGAHGERWTAGRILRGVQRRIRNRSSNLRDALFLRMASATGRLASLYYATVSTAFDNEHLAVTRGRQRYRSDGALASNHFFLLRRNVHRLEKGLVMRPRRSVFARDYIEDTVGAYAALADLSRQEPDRVDPRELRWAHDVLTEYFRVTGPDRALNRARAAFNQVGPSDLLASETLFIPHRRELDAPPPVGYRALLDLSMRRRSVRWFLPRPVPRDVIDQALEVAAQAPSACNRQPFEFRIIDEPDLLARVSRIPMGTGGFGQNIPVLAVVVGRLRAFAKERDRHLIYIDGALAAMAFVYALESLGLSSCCINWADARPQEKLMANAIGLAADERVVMLVAFGYPDPDGMVPFSAKKPLDLIRRYN